LLKISNSTSTANLTPSDLKIGSAVVNSTFVVVNAGNFVAGANVGANVNLTTVGLQIGNSSVNTQVNSSVFSTGTGNFSLAANVGANVKLTTVILSVGNSTVNSTVNSTAFFTTGIANVGTSVNSALIKVGTDFIANTSGVYHTGTVNAGSFTVTNFVANTAGVYHTGVVNTTYITVGTSFIANTTGAYVNATSISASTPANTTSNTTVATTEFVKNALKEFVYPVGSIYINATNSTNPGTLLGFGTWQAFGAGRVPVGFDSTNALFNTAEEIGGSADAIVVSHTHTANSTVTDPGHTHFVGNTGTGIGNAGGGNALRSNTTKDSPTTSNTTGISVSTTITSTGSSGTNANYQPYITVYMWKRTA